MGERLVGLTISSKNHIFSNSVLFSCTELFRLECSISENFSERVVAMTFWRGLLGSHGEGVENCTEWEKQVTFSARGKNI